jgi:hypothetical protein
MNLPTPVASAEPDNDTGGTGPRLVPTTVPSTSRPVFIVCEGRCERWTWHKFRSNEPVEIRPENSPPWVAYWKQMFACQKCGRMRTFGTLART